MMPTRRGSLKSKIHVYNPQEYILAVVEPETQISVVTKRIADKDLFEIERSSKASLRWSPHKHTELFIAGSELSVVLAQSMVGK